MLSLIIKKYTASVYLILVFVLAFTSINYSQPTNNNENFNSPLNRLRFGNYLFSERDYLRALNEFREYLKTEENDTVRFKFAECFYRINRFDEASGNFKSLFHHSPLSDEARLSFYKSEFFKNDFYSFRDYVEQENYLPSKYAKDVVRLRFISHFFDDSVLPDTNKFFPAFDDSNKTEIRKFYFMKKHPLRKNPTTAALLSVALPGLGKIYTGQIADGITAFVATGLLTFLSINNFDKDHQFRGWLFAGLAGLSYAGNIYGSAASAQIYNAGIKFNFDNEVKLYFEKRNYLLPENDWLK